MNLKLSLKGISFAQTFDIHCIWICIKLCFVPYFLNCCQVLLTHTHANVFEQLKRHILVKMYTFHVLYRCTLYIKTCFIFTWIVIFNVWMKCGGARNAKASINLSTVILSMCEMRMILYVYSCILCKTVVFHSYCVIYERMTMSKFIWAEN